MESKPRRKKECRYPTLTKISRNSAEIVEGIIVRDLKPLLIWSDNQQVWGASPYGDPGLIVNVDGQTYLELLKRARYDTAEIDNLAQWIARQPREAHAALYSYAVLELSVLAGVDTVLSDWERAVRILLDLADPHVGGDEIKRRWDRYVASYAGILVEKFFRFHRYDDIVERLGRTLNKSLLTYLLDNPRWEKMTKRRIISTLRSVYHRAVMQEVQFLAEAIFPFDEIDEERRKLLPNFDPHEELVVYAAREGVKGGLGKSASDLGIPSRDIYNRRRNVKRRRCG